MKTLLKVGALSVALLAGVLVVLVLYNIFHSYKDYLNNNSKGFYIAIYHDQEDKPTWIWVDVPFVLQGYYTDDGMKVSKLRLCHQKMEEYFVNTMGNSTMSEFYCYYAEDPINDMVDIRELEYQASFGLTWENWDVHEYSDWRRDNIIDVFFRKYYEKSYTKRCESLAIEDLDYIPRSSGFSNFEYKVTFEQFKQSCLER